MKLKLTYAFLLTVLVFTGCDNSTDETPLPENSLAALIQELGLPIQRDSLIACAASGQNGFLREASGQPVSVIYLPLENAESTWYFETESLVADKTDYSLYTRANLSESPLLNGFLRKFRHPGAEQEVIGIVASVRSGKLFLSNEINIKYSNQPTDFDPQQISIDQSTALMPRFSWPASEQAEDAIYFHVVSDAQDNLISGTYTFDREFQFYNLDNVVLNINDTDPAPALQSGEANRISVMAVSEDNWVNFFGSREFLTN